MINTEREQLILPSQVARMIPGRSGKGVSLSTVWRWMLRGRRGCRLESLMIGGQRYTSQEAVARFIAACNGHEPAHPQTRTERRQRQLRHVEHELLAEGF